VAFPAVVAVLAACRAEAEPGPESAEAAQRGPIDRRLRPRRHLGAGGDRGAADPEPMACRLQRRPFPAAAPGVPPRARFWPGPAGGAAGLAALGDARPPA